MHTPTASHRHIIHNTIHYTSIVQYISSTNQAMR